MHHDIRNAEQEERTKLVIGVYQPQWEWLAWVHIAVVIDTIAKSVGTHTGLA
jgi:hypothetical protein